jgi:hypothetical protein
MGIFETFFNVEEGWRDKLAWANHKVVHETGLTREKLREVLEHLERHGIIKSH